MQITDSSGTVLATGEAVSFSYSNAGIYDVSLVITDYNDCSSNTSEIQVIVGATTPGNPYVSAGDDFSIVCSIVLPNLSVDSVLDSIGLPNLSTACSSALYVS